MKAEGLIVHQLKDKDKWVAACKPMLNEYRAKGKEWSDFIDKILAIQ